MVFSSFCPSAKCLYKVVGITHWQDLVRLWFFQKANCKGFRLWPFIKVGDFWFHLAAVSAVEGQLKPLLLTCEQLATPGHKFCTCWAGGGLGQIGPIGLGKLLHWNWIWKADAVLAVVELCVRILWFLNVLNKVFLIRLPGSYSHVYLL